MIKRSIAIVVGLLAVLTLALVGAGEAQASTTTGRSCSSGGTTTWIWFNHTLDGNGIEQGNYFSWGTDPAAQLNRITISVRHNSSGNEEVLGAAGGTSDTLNDVPATLSYYVPGNWPRTVGTSGSIEWRGAVWGGVGNSTASCNTGWHLAD